MGKVKEIDWEALDKLFAIQATQVEIAGWFDMNVTTLENKVKQKYGITYSEYAEQKKGKGKISMRRSQFQRAEAGSDTMLIWWGKQYLGQSDKLDSRIIEDVKILPAVLPDKAPEKKEE